MGVTWTELKGIVVPIAVAALSASVLWLVRTMALRILHRWSRTTDTRLDDIVLEAVRVPSIYWCLALGLHLGVGVSDLPDRYIAWIKTAISVLVIFSVTLAAAGIAGRVLNDYIRRSNLPISGTGLAHGIIKGIILTVGFLVILSHLGISITPIITALGVGGLAVALALQDTLSNVFAGVHVLIEKPIRVGDFIRLETGQEGYVEDITWRTTRIRMLPNNMVIIPNNKITQSVITNYNLPEKPMSIPIPVGVGYSCDPETVERVLLEVASKAVGEVPGLLAEPAPSVRFIPGFGHSSLDFTLVCQVAEFTDQYLVQHELRKRILQRFRQEGIEIPFPQQTVHLKK